MNIHEYQAKEIFKEYNIPVSTGSVAFSADEIEATVNKVAGPTWVVKAQIHAGGRGKGGGVKVVFSIEDAIAEAKKMFGMTLITPQTGPEGKLVQRLYIENGSDIKKELYLSCLVDRSTSKIAFIVSKMGGMDIEKVAEETPEEITTVFIEPSHGVTDDNISTIANALGLSNSMVGQLDGLIKNLYKFFEEKDASLLEINPLIITNEDKLICLDAKVDFDDNALYRHPEIEELRDPNEEDKYELEAAKHDLAYIKLDGSIGCMVNGAGLAMASLDIIKLYGGEPANFLDVGGGASKEKVTSAFKIILSDPGVKGILVNIFGGIMRCDIIADGIVAAAKELNITVPLVVRLEGTNVQEGKDILNNSGIDIVSAADLDDAAKKIVELV
jgi:succinyl-CoA synthetase beta subunit|tara:strand:- start:3767 stop:4924 length:1158 start_codon:yes stop_codon:yes gene_type:complete